MKTTMRKLGWRNVMSLTVIAGALMLSACNGGGGGGGSSSGGGYISNAWYDVYGNYCGSGDPRPGCNFYSDRVKIIDLEDPYFASQYNLQYGVWEYYDSYGIYSSYLGWAFGSSTGIIYDEFGNALNETQDETGKDLLAEAGELEQVTVKNAGKQFADKFALSEESGVQIAKTLNDWATLVKDRKQKSRTDKDIEDFSKRLYGIDLKEAKQAITVAATGDMTQLESVNKDIAQHWGTTPETSEAILKNWYKDQLHQVGIK